MIFHFISGNLFNFINTSDSRICFLSGGLLLILGNYIVEPYFTKPSDSLINSSAVIVALMTINSKSLFIGYNVILIFSIAVLIVTLFSIALKDSSGKLKHVFFTIAVFFGSAKVLFSVIYIFGIFSYYCIPGEYLAFAILLTFWIILIFTNAIESLFAFFGKLFKHITTKTNDILGYAVGCDNPFLYTIESVNTKTRLKYGDLVTINKSAGVFYVGIVINIKYMLEKIQAEIYLLSKDAVPFELNFNKRIKNIFDPEKSVKNLDFSLISEEEKDFIEKSDLLINSSTFIGFVSTGSNVRKINFIINADKKKYYEGQIVKTRIQESDVLYQIIDGTTYKESLSPYDNNGFTVGTAMKIGVYNNSEKSIDVVKWVPSMFTPVFSINFIITDEKLQNIASENIGRLPESDLGIPIKDIQSLVTHNTAILGILGIGKSCLAFELIKKITEENIKIICIDITNQYKAPNNGLAKYIDESRIQKELLDADLALLKSTEDTEPPATSGRNDPSLWGNESTYKNILKNEIDAFLEGDQKVLILNPDWHAVKKSQGNFNIEASVALSAAEKTRLISESAFIRMRKKGESEIAKLLIVYEEAHSLIPEMNSVASTGDKNATNGTAKVILQGRKYGLGCMVLTQRTANISKSILNQCNTIFALRVFDDTGKTFLENYIGKDYSNTLPQLEERHAIAIGKGLKLKQPIIIQLNDREYIFKEDA